MFRLDKPISCVRPVSDFDDIGTILTHSSITGSKKAAKWQQFVEEDGHIFYIELPSVTDVCSQDRNKETDVSSLCSYCSTRSTQSITSEDTGYSSDGDNQSSHLRLTSGTTTSKSQASRHSKSAPSVTSVPVFADVEEEDDGVSVDCDEAEQQSASRNSSSVSSSCGLRAFRTKSFLCSRHSESLCTCGKYPGRCVSSGNRHSLCKGTRSSGCMEQINCRSQDRKKEVVIRTGGHAWDEQHGLSWLEAVLGIVPGRARHLSQNESAVNLDSDVSQRVIVSGLTPEGLAVQNKEILIGDYICSVNGRQVTWNNLESVAGLLNSARKVRLLVERASNHLYTSGARTDRVLLNTASITRLLSSSSGNSRRNGHRHMQEVMGSLHVVYMSMQGVSSDNSEHKEDILYKFPKDDTGLSDLRGLCYTLTHLLTDDSDIDIIELAVILGGKNVSIFCCKEGKDLLIVAAPVDRMLTYQLKSATCTIQRLLRFLFGSVEAAFRSPQNHSTVNDFLEFLITFLSRSFKVEKCIKSKSTIHGYMDCLPLPHDIFVAVNNILTEFESAEFADMSETFYGCRRMFTILGSLVFYKGYAVCSHLGQDHAVDIFSYLYHSGLIHLTSRYQLHQLLVWHEVFPTQLCHDVTDINSVFGYSEPHARWFLMIMGMKNLLLVTLLEAGGCASQIEGVCLPDPFYVDQARATALRLQTPDLISACETRLRGEGLPGTVTVDKLTGTHDASIHGTQRLEPLLRNPHTIRLHLTSSTSSLPALSNNTLPPGCSVGRWEVSGTHGKHYHLAELKGLPFVVDSDVNVFKVGSGKDNLVLMYCQVNTYESSLTSSTSFFNMSTASDLHRQVAENFWRCCSTMHADFARSMEVKPDRRDSLLADFGADHIWCSCREKGTLFTVTPLQKTDSRKPLSLSYWVVGRKLWYPQPREVYVCFHECTPQNIIELAFRVSAGTWGMS